MSTPEEIADALDAAADYIEVHGWCQHEFSDGDRVCMARAINSVSEGSVMEDALFAVSDHVCGVFSFNDEDGRTEYEVIDALRLCAKGLRPVELPDPHHAAQLRDEAMAERYAR